MTQAATKSRPEQVQIGCNLKLPELKPKVAFIVNKKSKIAEKINNKLWFHGIMSRESAVHLLRDHGDFLVRQNNQHEFILSVKYKTTHMHINLVDESGSVGAKDKKFETILEFINHYSNYQVPLVAPNGQTIVLGKAIIRNCKS